MNSDFGTEGGKTAWTSTEGASETVADDDRINDDDLKLILELFVPVYLQLIARPVNSMKATVSRFPPLRELASRGLPGVLAPSSGTETPTDIRLLIVDDSRVNRECLTAQISQQNVNASCAWDLESLISQMNRLDWDVVLLNINTRDSDTLMHVSLDRSPIVRVVVFGLAEDRLSQIVSCAESGVAGIHLNSESFEHLLGLIRDGAKVGKAACSPTVSAILKDHPAPPEPLLSPREKQILELLEAGLSNQQIATRLSVTVHTVKNHVHQVLTKLGVSTRAEAAASCRAKRYQPS